MASKSGTPSSRQRSAKTVTQTQQRVFGSEEQTPSTSKTSPGRRVRSPSPARITRQEEKEQLQNLNDRLATYIDRVRFLETENSRLQVQVRSSEETVNREVTNIKSLYESELEDARRLLDETAKEKARLHIEVGKYKAEVDEWKTKYQRRDKEAREAENALQQLEKENRDLAIRAGDAEERKKQLEKENNKLRADLAALERQLAHAKKQLEDETLLRVDAQNRLQSVKEDLQFKTQLHEQELNESRTRTVTEVEEVDSSVRHEYETKLQDALQLMREEQDAQLKDVRVEMELLYEKKLGDLQGALDRSMNSSSLSSEDLRVSRRRADELSSEMTKLRAQNAAFESRILDLETQLTREQQEFLERLALKEQELCDLRDSLHEQTQEYADLMDIKIRLDNEITAYRKLLEGEEERLNLSQSSSPGTPTGRGQKRKRVALSETVQELGESSAGSGFSTSSHASSNVVIEDMDPEGKFVKLKNTSDDDIAIGSWQLKLHHSEDEDAEDKTSYKFHRSLILKAGQTCTVWSSGIGQTHKPPSDLVMKGQQWMTNQDCMVSVLLNTEGSELARRTMTKRIQRISTSTYRTIGGDTIDSGRRGSDRCSIM